MVRELVASSGCGPRIFSFATSDEKSQWLRARDLLAGDNGSRCDLVAGLALAEQCQHEEAQWFCRLAKRHNGFGSLENAIEVMKMENHFTGMSDYFVAMWANNGQNPVWMEQAANRGYARAQAKVVLKGRNLYLGGLDDRKFVFSRESALAGDPAGHFAMYLIDPNDYFSLWQSVLGGWVEAYREMANVATTVYSLEYFALQGWGAIGGDSKAVDDYTSYALKVSAMLTSGLPRYAKQNYEIGRLLSGQMDERNDSVFGIPFSAYRYKDFKTLRRMVTCYERSRDQARAAVDGFLRCAVNFNWTRDLNARLNKDLRKKIVLTIWELRFEWLINFR